MSEKEKTPQGKAEADQLIEDLFHQVCFDPKTRKYHHGCLSAFERAQNYLIKNGQIKKTECEVL